ncbi:hypothetical protein [Pseudarthrobacter sulfonivorans]|uniref:hypothetical protein n=1 Tax=Pseudarthrobacter sulfonivorans TaxID=121292 RepID=UPI0014289A0D|nr:hypothetical protein [Pseudarthrobacter sulfonivorans]
MDFDATLNDACPLISAVHVVACDNRVYDVDRRGLDEDCVTAAAEDGVAAVASAAPVASAEAGDAMAA